jgi:hypothetical protein
MSEILATSFTRREFAARMTVLGGSAVLFAAVPFSSSALADGVRKWGVVPQLDMGRDEALENYPGYAANIPSGKAQVCAEFHHAAVDGQYLV